MAYGSEANHGFGKKWRRDCKRYVFETESNKSKWNINYNVLSFRTTNLTKVKHLEIKLYGYT